MWVASNDVEKVVDWFYRRSSAQFLGLFVAGDRKFDALLRAVITDRQTIDVILGPSVDLVLFSDAEFEPSMDTSLRRISKLTKWTPKLTRSIPNATIMTTHDIASSLKLGIDDLPGLVLLRRRTGWRDNEPERLTLSLRGATDVEFLIDFLRAFRRSIERIETARSARFKFSEASLAEVERDMNSRIEQTAVVDKRVKRIARIANETQEIAAPSDNKSEKARVAEQRLSKAEIAKYNAEVRIAKLDAKICIDSALKCVMLADEEITKLQAVLDHFERRLSYGLGRDRLFKFLGLSEKMLGPVKRIIRLAVAIKTGGAAL